MSESVPSLADLLRRDRRYHPDAYAFVFDALGFAQAKLGMGRTTGDAEREREDVTGQELCEAIRCYGLQQYGALAKHVFHQWGVRSTDDFGEIVFNLIEIGKMRKTENDRREDFSKVFDFDEGLRDPFRAIPSDSSGERHS